MHRHAKNNDSNRFCNFYKRVTDRQTNVPTDGPMDQLTDGDAIAASKNDPLLCINYSLRNAIRFFFYNIFWSCSMHIYLLHSHNEIHLWKWGWSSWNWGWLITTSYKLAIDMGRGIETNWDEVLNKTMRQSEREKETVKRSKCWQLQYL